MPDRPEFDNEAEAVASVAEPVEETAPTPEPEPAPTADAAPDPDMFPRDYVEELRRENAKYRTRAQQYEQAFDGYDDDTRTQLLTYFQLAKRAESGDQDAQRELNEWLADDEPDDTPDDDGPDFSRMTPAEFVEFQRELAREEAQRLYDAREQHTQQIAAVEGVRATAEQMGYDPSSPDYILLLKFANELDPAEHPDLLAAAHAQVEAYHESILERRNADYLAKKERDTVASPRVASQGGSPDLSAGPPKTFAEARARMDERFSNT